MEYSKIILIAEYDSDMPSIKSFIDWSLKGYTYEAIYINDKMILLETAYTVAEIELELKEIGAEDVKVLFITENNVCEMLGQYGNITDILIAIKKLELPNDINYYLDLMISRGQNMLTDKELNKLNEIIKTIE